jgi:hypothetical protein
MTQVRGSGDVYELVRCRAKRRRRREVIEELDSAAGYGRSLDQTDVQVRSVAVGGTRAPPAHCSISDDPAFAAAIVVRGPFGDILHTMGSSA